MPTEQPLGPKLANTRETIELSPELNAHLDEICVQHGVAKLDIIRRALVLFDVGVAAIHRDERIAVVDRNGRIVQEVVGLL